MDTGARSALTSVLFLLALDPAVAQPRERPDAFVRRVYGRYRDHGPGVSRDRPAGAAFYAAALLDAFPRADASVAEDDIGPIDRDPLCACQRFEDLHIESLAVERADVTSASVRVAFVDQRHSSVVTLKVLHTPRGWRIADIGDGSVESVMAVLRDAIAHPTRHRPRRVRRDHGCSIPVAAP